MRKKLFVIALMAVISSGLAHAQFYTTFDPFVNGDKYLGVDVGLGGWLGSSNALLKGSSTTGPYAGFAADKLKRPPLCPSVALVYKRVLPQNNVSVASIYRIGMNWWNGTVEGSLTANPSTTFTTKYNYRTVEVTDIYALMIPVGDAIYINAGLGLTIGLNLGAKSTIEYSDGRESVNTTGGGEFMDIMLAEIDFVAGMDYMLNDSFSLSLNLIGYPLDFFGLFDDADTKGLRGVGEGLFVSKKFPFHLTAGITFAL